MCTQSCDYMLGRLIDYGQCCSKRLLLNWMHLKLARGLKLQYRFVIFELFEESVERSNQIVDLNKVWLLVPIRQLLAILSVSD